MYVLKNKLSIRLYLIVSILLICFINTVLGNESNINNQKNNASMSSDKKDEFHAGLEKQGYTFNSQKEINELERRNKETIEKYFNEKTGEFIPNITEREKILVYRAYVEWIYLMTDQFYYRFDRTEEQPIVYEVDRKKKELEIQEILDQCVALIGPEANDHIYSLNVQQDQPYSTMSYIFEGMYDDGHTEVFKNIQRSYLEGRVAKCNNYLYGEIYSLKSFDYPTSSKLLEVTKKQKIEALYTQAYLKIKAAGLLVHISTAYYPKLLIREFADQSGLTKYIYKKERLANQPLNHEELAIEYFGSREKWIKSLNHYINQQMGKLNNGC